MQNLNSDELRRQLDENNAAMNTLAEDNQKIVELLAERGLQAIDSASNDVAIHACIMQLGKLRSEPKPLTADELKAGGWWCADTSDDALKAFILYGLAEYGDDMPWDGSFDGCFIFKSGTNLLDRGYKHHTSALKQIHRIGNNFYWGAPNG